MTIDSSDLDYPVFAEQWPSALSKLEVNQRKIADELALIRADVDDPEIERRLNQVGLAVAWVAEQHSEFVNKAGRYE